MSPTKIIGKEGQSFFCCEDFQSQEANKGHLCPKSSLSEPAPYATSITLRKETYVPSQNQCPGANTLLEMGTEHTDPSRTGVGNGAWAPQPFQNSHPCSLRALKVKPDTSGFIKVKSALCSLSQKFISEALPSAWKINVSTLLHCLIAGGIHYLGKTVFPFTLTLQYFMIIFLSNFHSK